MARSIESFEIRKFSTFVIVDSTLPANISQAPNTWYHYPYRMGLSVSFVEGKNDTTIFIYWKATCLEKVSILPPTKLLCSFITHYPSIGFKQVSLSGSILKRFQLSFLDKKHYNNCIKYLTASDFSINELKTRPILNNGSQIIISNLQQDPNSSTDFTNSTSDLSLQSQTRMQDSQWVEDSQFDTSQVLPSFSTQIPGLNLIDPNDSINWDMFNTDVKSLPDFSDMVLGDYNTYTENRGFKPKKKKNNKKDWKSMSDKQLKEYIVDHLNNDDFIAFVTKIDNLLSQDRDS